MRIVRIMLLVMDEKTVALLAAEAQVDKRTAKKAVDNGVDSIKGGFVRDRLRAAAKKLGVRLS